MLNRHVMKLMSDAHLIASVEQQLDAITSTDIELELLDRFKALHAVADSHMAEVIDEFSFTADQLATFGNALIGNVDSSVQLLQAIGDAGFDSVKQLKEELELARQFRALASDAGDAFTRLHTLATVTQE